MFGKYVFKMQTNWVLNTTFSYDPAKLTPVQRDIYNLIIDGSYAEKGKPVDAAVFFMMVQASMTNGEVRKGQFVAGIWAAVEELRHEMSPAAFDHLTDWIGEFIAESNQQDIETESETSERHLSALLALENQWQVGP